MMENAPSEGSDWSWNDMIEALRALGGAVENIVMGADGRGLFSANPANPVLLRVPRNLLFRVDDIEVADGRIAIRQSAEIPEAERRFFNRYEIAFSSGARARSAAFIMGLDALPGGIQELLRTEFGLSALLQGDFANRLQTHSLRNREVPWQDRRVIAPVLELASHGMKGLGFERGTHLQIQGYAVNEILVRHSAEDAYSTFCRSGVAERRPAAFSVPMTVRLENRQIVMRRDTHAGVMRGSDRVPKMSMDGGTISLSYLLLGHRTMPRRPRVISRTLLREAGLKYPDEFFDRVLEFNAMKFIKLLQALEAHEGEMVSALRKMARYQLEAMTWCIGARDSPPAPVAAD